MTRSRIIRSSLALLLALLPAAVSAREAGEICHGIEERAVVICSDGSARRVAVGGAIVSAAATGTGVYYCAVRDGAEAGELTLGFVDGQSAAVSFERSIPVNTAERRVARFMAGEGGAYVLSVPGDGQGAAGELLRVSVPSGEISRVQGVIDFFLQGTDCFMLDDPGSGPRVMLNELAVPLSLRGEDACRIRDVIDGRIVLVSAGDETEIIDIRTGKSLYQYATRYDFMEPDGYNTLIQAVDMNRPGHDDRTMIFYKVFVDGVESGRTDSGPAGLAREIKLFLEPNRYHQVRLERWVLSQGRGRYERENNIRQPKMQELYIPQNRIVKLVITASNNDYSYKIIPVYR